MAWGLPTPGCMFTDQIQVVVPYEGRTLDDGLVRTGVDVTPPERTVALRLNQPIDTGDLVGVNIGGTDYAVPFSGQDDDTLAQQVAALITGSTTYTVEVVANQLVVDLGQTAGVDNEEVFSIIGRARITGKVVTITGSLQPISSARDRELVPEQYRQSELVIVYSSYLLQKTSESKKRQADIVRFMHNDGEIRNYEVIQVDSYEMGTLDHVEAICVRLVQGTYH